MKKALALLLALSMLVVLAACSTAAAPDATPETTNEPAAASQPATDETQEEAQQTQPKTSETEASVDEQNITLDDVFEGFDMTADGFVIGFSNSFNGNAYHQQAEANFTLVAERMKEAGVISDYFVTEAGGDNATQSAQIESLILKGVDALIVDPGSATALNGALEEAVAAGIPTLIVNDGPVTAEGVYNLTFDYSQFASPCLEWVCEKLNGTGKIVLCRGMAGNECDNEIYAAWQATLKNYPDIEVVSEIYGEWNNGVSQQQMASVLPVLDQVDAVICEGGDAWGVVQAFQAANREVPIVTGGNRGYFLNWWASVVPDGYEAVSGTTNPDILEASLFVAIDILRGKEVKKELDIGCIMIYQEDMVNNLDYYAQMDPESIANVMYTYDWVCQNIYTQK